MKPVLAIAGLCVKEIFRKKDFYVALILTGMILVYASNLRFYNVGNIVRYLMEIGLMLVFFSSVILSVALAARQIPAEVENRTAQVLLAKPISRAQFTMGKYLGCLLAGWVAFGIFYAVFLIAVWAKAEVLSPVLAAQTAYLFMLNLAIVTAMALAFSTVMTVSANVTICLVLYLLINTYGPALKSAGLGPTTYFLPHFEFFDLRQRFIHEWEPLAPNLLGFLTLYAVLFAAFFLSLASTILKKRRF